MYRIPDAYNKMAELVGDIYIDYDIHSFPVDEKEVCRKLGILLKPYGDYSPEKRELFKKKSESGFYVPPSKNAPPMIFYNDRVFEVGSYGKIRRNIFHEVKHYICEDTEEQPEDDDLADYFGKYFLAPISYLIVLGIDDIHQIVSRFRVDNDIAFFIRRNIKNRRDRYGNLIFDYEKPLLQHLLGDQYDYIISNLQKN